MAADTPCKALPCHTTYVKIKLEFNLLVRMRDGEQERGQGIAAASILAGITQPNGW
jgi:hypothetical protein